MWILNCSWHYEHFALGLCWRVYKRRFGSSSAKHKLDVAEMLPNPLFSQSNSHSQSLSLSQRRRLLLQVPPSCCPDQNVPIWAHKHAVQNVLQPKIQKQKNQNKLVASAVRTEFYLAFFGFFLRVFYRSFLVSFCAWVSARCQLRCGTWIYIYFFFWVRISLDIETFERVLCNYSISWRCKQPNSSAYLALIADLQLILPISIYRLYGHIELQPPIQRMHFQSQVKDATAERMIEGEGRGKRVCSAVNNNNEITIIILLFFSSKKRNIQNRRP